MLILKYDKYFQVVHQKSVSIYTLTNCEWQVCSYSPTLSLALVLSIFLNFANKVKMIWKFDISLHILGNSKIEYVSLFLLIIYVFL